MGPCGCRRGSLQLLSKLEMGDDDSVKPTANLPQDSNDGDDDSRARNTFANPSLHSYAFSRSYTHTPYIQRTRTCARNTLVRTPATLRASHVQVITL